MAIRRVITGVAVTLFLSALAAGQPATPIKDTSAPGKVVARTAGPAPAAPEPVDTANSVRERLQMLRPVVCTGVVLILAAAGGLFWANVREQKGKSASHIASGAAATLSAGLGCLVLYVVGVVSLVVFR